MTPLPDDPDHAEHCADILKALGHPLRLRLIALLCESQENVAGIARRLGARQSAVSQQLRILRLNGLVDAERSDGFSVYRLAEPRLRQLVACVERCGTPIDLLEASNA